MLVYFTDAQSGNAVAVNPKHVVVVFVSEATEGITKTVINTTTGNLLVEESYIDVIGTLQGQY